MSTPRTELERLVRYCHPRKRLAPARLPGLDALDDTVLARLYGASPADYRAGLVALHAEAREAACELADMPSVRAAVAALPLRLGDRMVALGDSHTDDVASWAEILRRLFSLLRGGDGIRVVNAGVSGDTTTAVMARLELLPPSAVTLVMIGTNDARRHGRDGAPMLVSHPETQRNLAAIGAALHRRTRDVVWITPPPIDEARIAVDPRLVESDLTWRHADVAEKARLVRSLDSEAVDLWPLFTTEHLAADGLHPSPAGQRAIAERLVHVLANRASNHSTANAVSSAAGRR